MPPLGHRGRTSARAGQHSPAPPRNRQRGLTQPGHAGYALSPIARLPSTPRNASRATQGRDTAATRSARRHSSTAMRSPGTRVKHPRSPDATVVPSAAQDTDTGDTTAPNTPNSFQERRRDSPATHAGPAPMRPRTPRYQDTSGASHPGHTHVRTDTHTHKGAPGTPRRGGRWGAGSPAERSAADCECDRPPPRLPINHPTQALLLQALTLHWLDAESSPVNDSREEHTRGVSSSPAPPRTPTPPQKKSPPVSAL